jgi:effector-binding domain-containing protein
MTNYRYYTVDQLPRLNRILVLKDLGFALDQIKALMAEEVSVDQMRGMLLLRRAEAEQAMQEAQARLARIQARLDQLGTAGESAPYDVVIKDVPAVTVAFVRRIIPTYGAMGDLFTALFAAPIRPVSPPLVLYHDNEYREQDPDVELAVPITHPIEGASCRELSAVTVAATIYPGRYEGITAGYTALIHWLEASPYTFAGPIREVYLRGYGQVDSPNDFLTEIQIPLESRGAHHAED